MSTVESTSFREALSAVPEFDLECIYDDPENPAELTVFSPRESELTTAWITVDRDTAVPLEDIE